jgi:hypothetical protein
MSLFALSLKKKILKKRALEIGSAGVFAIFWESPYKDSFLNIVNLALSLANISICKIQMKVFSFWDSFSA